MTHATIIAKLDDELLTTFIGGDGYPEITGRLLHCVYNTPEQIRAICKTSWEFLGTNLAKSVPLDRNYSTRTPFCEDNLYWRIIDEGFPESHFIYYWNGEQWIYFSNCYEITDEEYVEEKDIMENRMSETRWEKYKNESDAIYDAKDKSPMQKTIEWGKIVYKYMIRIPDEYRNITSYIITRDIMLDNIKISNMKRRSSN